jgi:hypothetical protein
VLTTEGDRQPAKTVVEVIVLDFSGEERQPPAAVLNGEGLRGEQRRKKNCRGRFGIRRRNGWPYTSVIEMIHAFLQSVGRASR